MEGSVAMTNERWQKVKTIFLQAIELDAGKEREEFLRAICRHDLSLLKEVEGLIRSHEGAGDFIQNPFVITANGLFASDTHADLSPGQRITHYEIEREIGNSLSSAEPSPSFHSSSNCVTSPGEDKSSCESDVSVGNSFIWK